MNSGINGFFQVYRKIDNWEWRTDPKVFSVFMYCLSSAAWKDHRFKGTIIKRGSFPTSRTKIALSTGLTVRSVRTCLERLISTSELTKVISAKGTIITVVRYEDYQATTSVSTSERPANDQLTTTQNKGNKEKKKKVLLSGWSEHKQFHDSLDADVQEWCLAITNPTIQKWFSIYPEDYIRTEIEKAYEWDASKGFKKTSIGLFLTGWFKRGHVEDDTAKIESFVAKFQGVA